MSAVGQSLPSRRGLKSCDVRFTPKATISLQRCEWSLSAMRWGNRPADLWIAEDLAFSDSVHRAAIEGLRPVAEVLTIDDMLRLLAAK